MRPRGRVCPCQKCSACSARKEGQEWKQVEKLGCAGLRRVQLDAVEVGKVERDMSSGNMHGQVPTNARVAGRGFFIERGEPVIARSKTVHLRTAFQIRI